jgi:ribose transport system permease protein
MTTQPNDPASPRHRPWLRFAESYALLGAWLIVIVVFAIALPGSFLTWTNFSVMFTTQSPGAILALALIVPLTAGDYDLSVGAAVTLSAILIGALNVWGQMPIGWVLAITILAGGAVGLVNAFFVVVLRIPSLVVTLGTASLITGLVQWLSGSSTIGGISPWLVRNTAERQIFGLSYAFYYAVITAALLWYVFGRTPLGQRLLFVGRGREVARQVGINVGRVRAGCLVASSMLATLAGIIYVGLLGAADPVSGLNFLLPAFAAAYLGATSIVPGRFNPWGAFIAVYFLSSGITGLSMLGIPLWVTSVFNGGALILAVTLSQFARGRAQMELG